MAKCTKIPTFNTNRIDVKTASCSNIEISSGIYVGVQIGTLKQQHKFMICEYLVFPVILDTDFMCKHGIHIDFKSQTITANNLGVVWPPPNVSEACSVHTNPESYISYFLPFQAKQTLYSITYQQTMPLEYESQLAEFPTITNRKWNVKLQKCSNKK